MSGAGFHRGGADVYGVKLEVFEGPLDLLLFLIRKNEVDIYDIPIAEITRHYLGYVELMRHLDLEQAGDFVLMAATLMKIKSQMLLPAEVEDQAEVADCLEVVESDLVDCLEADCLEVVEGRQAKACQAVESKERAQEERQDICASRPGEAEAGQAAAEAGPLIGPIVDHEFMLELS